MVVLSLLKTYKTNNKEKPMTTPNNSGIPQHIVSNPDLNDLAQLWAELDETARTQGIDPKSAPIPVESVQDQSLLRALEAIGGAQVTDQGVKLTYEEAAPAAQEPSPNVRAAAKEHTFADKDDEE
jgi:hypothetical protein